MKKILTGVLAALLLVVFLSSCQDDDADKSPLYGYWTRSITDSSGVTFYASIEFTEDMEMFWKPIGENTGHTSSNAKFEFVDNNSIQLIEDSDCGDDDNLYIFQINNSVLTIMVNKDDCTLRAPMISGIWTKSEKDYL